jgi:uncharacterized protein (TIGR02246 family)
MARRDVEAGEKAWLAAFNGGDASGVASTYTDNARLMAPNMDTLEGRAAIEDFIKGFVATGAKLEFDVVDVHDGGAICVSVGTYRMTIPGEPDDRGKYIEVWARQPDGSWRIRDDIFNSSMPVPA